MLAPREVHRKRFASLRVLTELCLRGDDDEQDLPSGGYSALERVAAASAQRSLRNGSAARTTVREPRTPKDRLATRTKKAARTGARASPGVHSSTAPGSKKAADQADFLRILEDNSCNDVRSVDEALRLFSGSEKLRADIASGRVPKPKNVTGALMLLHQQLFE
jgi:hypothetical protein